MKLVKSFDRLAEDWNGQSDKAKKGHQCSALGTECGPSLNHCVTPCSASQCRSRSGHVRTTSWMIEGKLVISAAATAVISHQIFWSSASSRFSRTSSRVSRLPSWYVPSSPVTAPPFDCCDDARPKPERDCHVHDQAKHGQQCFVAHRQPPPLAV